MVYSFFSRWKVLQSDVFSLEKEIKALNIFYRLRVALFQKIWESLNKEKIDYRNAQRLSNIYNNQKYIALYDLLSTKISKIYGQHLLPDSEVYSFSELLGFLSEKMNEEKKLAENLLDKLISGTIPEKRFFYAIQDLLRQESIYLNQENKKFKALEDFFLLNKNPGSGSKSYINIVDAIKKRIITFDSNTFYYDGKPLQGVKAKDNLIIIKGDHYSSFQNARWIQGDRFVQPSLKDPYSYFVERGKLSGFGPQEIQKILGINNAEATVALEIVVFPEQLYIKIEPGKPTKFAIAQLRVEQVKKVIKEASMVA